MADQQPIIDSNPNDPARDWRRDRVLAARPFFVAGVAFFLIAVAVALACFKSCTDLGRAAKGDVYAYYGDDDGFVGRADQLLAELLTDTVEGVQATDLASLHRKYPALEFELPRAEAAKCVVEAADLRLVGIRPERIKSSNLRHFYHNSRLPQLLRQQHEKLGECLFHIAIKRLPGSAKTDYAMPFAISSITLNRSVAQVNLTKNLWDGRIIANTGCLFNDNSFIYITFGNSAIPLPIGKEFANRASGNALVADRSTMHIVTQDGSPVDYYQLFRNTTSSGGKKEEGKASKKDANATASTAGSKQIRFELADERGRLHHGFSIDCKGDSLRFTMQTGVELHVYSSTKQGAKTESSACVLRGEGKHIVRHDDGMKIAVYEGRDKHKFGEFTISHTDPSRVLSRIVQTQTGSSRYTIGEEMTDLFTQQMTLSLTRLMTGSRTHDDVSITLDPLLSREFESELKDYLHETQRTLKHPERQTQELYDISLTVMDMATGDILAVPFFTTDFDAPRGKNGVRLEAPDAAHRLATRNVGLARRYLGSTFKPLVAMAATESNDHLFNLVINDQCSIVSDQPYEAQFFGRRTRGWAKATPGMWARSCDFTQFLSLSDDIYPVALAAIAMTGTSYDGMHGTLPAKGWMDEKQKKGVSWLTMKNFDDENAATSPFTDWLSHITGASLYSETPDTALLRHLALNDGSTAIQRAWSMNSVCPDPTNLHIDMFTGGDFRGTLVPWVLGQGSNEWSTIQIATAWARMLSGHAVLPSYIKTTDSDAAPSLFADTYSGGSNLNNQQPLPETRRRQIWTNFLSRFREAQKGGTLAPMNSQVAQLNTSLNLSGGRELVVFAKTGTPDAYARYDMPIMGGNSRYFDVGLFTFGLMRESELQAARSGRLPHGIVGVVRITRTYQCKECDKARRAGSRTQCEVCRKENGLSSSHARSFFAENPARLRKFYDMTRRYY